MTQRRFHYEQAFEHYLRANRIPYVAVDEAKKALLPAGSGSAVGEAADARKANAGGAIKSFDFVVYAESRNLLVDVKGRMFGSAAGRSSLSNRRFESWVTLEDIEGLQRWQELFGGDFEAIFVFAYCLRQQPPDALFESVLSHGGRWYALREIALASYRRHMVRRSEKWGTVHIPAKVYHRISRPFLIHPPAACDSPEGAIC
ncbi:MAG: HYExAFE family protein [Phycisphaerales bacterium]|nr:MAG: HYExAFE family protein [Phycisphaerales bacterium]